MTHRECIKDWLSKIHLDGLHVIDWGSGSKPVMRYISHKNCTFTTIDKNPLIDSERRSSHHVTFDINFPIKLEKADAAFCIEVLEHSLFTEDILANIYNNLKRGRNLYLTMPYDFPVHSEDDYLRYTENGLRAHLTRAGFIVEELDMTEDNQGYLVKARKE